MGPECAQREGKGNFLEGAAALKSGFADINNTFRQIHFLQAAAAGEGAGGNETDGRGNTDGDEGGAGVEGRILDGGKPFRQGNFLQGGTAVESVWRYPGHSIRQRNVLQVLAAVESFLLQNMNGFGQGNKFQMHTVREGFLSNKLNTVRTIITLFFFTERVIYQLFFFFVEIFGFKMIDIVCLSDFLNNAIIKGFNCG